MVVFVFVPVWSFMIPLNFMMIGKNWEGGATNMIATTLYLYLPYAIPAILGSVIHSIVVILTPWCWPMRLRQFVTVMFSPLVPATILIYGGLGGTAPLYVYWIATTIGTVAYGLCSSLRLPRITEKN